VEASRVDNDGLMPRAHLIDDLADTLRGLGDHRYRAEETFGIIALDEPALGIRVDDRGLMAKTEPVRGQAAGKRGFPASAMTSYQVEPVILGSPQIASPNATSLLGMKDSVSEKAQKSNPESKTHP
jgi:hypothetical protein